MKILVAPDSFKGCLSSVEVCSALEIGIKQFDSDIEIIKIPSSDGGEGFCDCMLNLFGGERIKREVSSPLNHRIVAEYVFNSDSKTAYIEFASAAGLALVPEEERDILASNSYGVGELIADAIDNGANTIVIGLGGSATNDCGIGILSAMGVKFYDNNGNCLAPIPKNLDKISRIDKSEMLDISGVTLIAACDVRNPLCGENGAARVFAPQKGATQCDVEFLESAAFKFSEILGIDPSEMGYGAAGGAGMALVGILGASYVSGAELLVNSQRFSESLDSADMVITGEGNTDSQSVFGKLVSVVVSFAKQKGVKTVVISGGLSKGFETLGADEYYALCQCEAERDYAISNAFVLLSEKAKVALKNN